MALYKDQTSVQYNTDKAFDVLHTPGNSAPFAGIYKCITCGHEIGIAEGHILPSQNHAQHDPRNGQIIWKLLVFAQHNK